MINRRLAARGRRKTATSLVAGLLSVAGVSLANAQQQPSPGQVEEALPKSGTSQQKNDITVIGTVEADSTSTVPIKQRSELVASSRFASAEAYRFVRCAKRADPKLVRKAIEGLPHRYDSEYALDRIIREEQSCYSGLPTPPVAQPPYYGACNPILIVPGEVVCRAFFDRGALIERAISKITPRLSLRDGSLADPAVIHRFNARTAALNTTRYPQERIGYAVVACMVATHTTDAVGLLRSEPGSRGEARLSAVLLGQSPQCLGGAKKISTDPRQFRVYVAETVYFFAVAFRDVASLIPEDAKRE